MAGATVAHRGELPRFLSDRNERALRAGLSITRAVVADGTATHWYEGTPEQILAAGFVLGGERWKWPTKGQRAKHVVVTSPTDPHGNGMHWCGVKVLADGRLRVSAANEPLPLSCSVVAPGVERFDTVGEREGRIAVLLGKPEALLASGLIEPAALTDWWGKLPGCTVSTATGIGVAWSARTVPDGRRMVRIYLDAPARLERWKRERSRQSIENLDGYRQRLAVVGECLTVLCSDLEMEAKDGSRYSIAPDSLDEITLAAAKLRGLLETAVLRVERPRLPKVTDQAVQSAQGDQALQAWLRGIGSVERRG